MDRAHEPLRLVKVLYVEISWTYIKVLFESLFSLMELLNMAVFRIYDVMLEKFLTTLCRIL
jgi:hypothetical protein